MSTSLRLQQRFPTQDNVGCEHGSEGTGALEHDITGLHVDDARRPRLPSQNGHHAHARYRET